ncbi:MAG: hypothetical protein LBV67_04340 [Streptococcaceae bacterium]|jgi:hypothetical protein|nr:hypothetical protein [Streptococcaceae bacterium]
MKITKEQFRSILGATNPSIIEIIKAKLSISYDEAVWLFYHSNTYRLLENKETNYWYYPSDYLAEIFFEEKGYE